MIIDLVWPVAALLNAAMWISISVVVGWRQAQRPLAALRPRRREQIRDWERHGQWYVQHLAVRRWKRWLPDAGSWFGGLSKRHRPELSAGGWSRLAAECVRAERTHRGVAMATPIFAIWNSPGMFLVNVAVAVVLNLPCWVVARSTRGRVEALLTRVGGGAFIEPSADE